MSRSLTAAAVDRLKPPASGQKDHFDKGYPGLALRISHGGAKAWTYVYRLYGKLHRTTLGRYPAMSLKDAREAWRGAQLAVSKGENPKHRRPTAADTFDEVVLEWLKRDQGDNRSLPDVRRVIEFNVTPKWQGRLVTSLRRRDVVLLIDAATDRGAVTMARRLHSHLHRFFRWCVGRGLIEQNPMTDLPKPGDVVKRDRVLSDPEISLVWRAADRMGWPFGPIVQLLILTAARRDEIGALKWSEISSERSIELSGARTKNGEPRSIPLVLLASRILERQPRVSDFVFSTRGTTPVSGWSKAKTMLDHNVAALNGGAPLPSWRLHDLRRTVATAMQRLGVSLQVVEEVLGHVSGSRAGVVGIYQRHGYRQEKRAALDLWSNDLNRILTVAAKKDAA
jgi:integrase